MKTKINISAIAMYVTIGLMTLVLFTFDKRVEKSIVKSYSEWRLGFDSVPMKKQKNPISIRETYKELVRDSIVAKLDSASLELYILKPELQKDSVMRGGLFEIYWKKVPRQKVAFLEDLMKK